jgi:hypothetical protein
MPANDAKHAKPELIWPRSFPEEFRPAALFVPRFRFRVLSRGSRAVSRLKIRNLKPYAAARTCGGAFSISSAMQPWGETSS